MHTFASTYHALIENFLFIGLVMTKRRLQVRRLKKTIKYTNLLMRINLKVIFFEDNITLISSLSGECNFDTIFNLDIEPTFFANLL